MLIGIMGKMGSGKTLFQTILAEYIATKTGVPLYANYGLENSKRINTLGELWTVDSSIFCFDEIWLTMDSRLWADNVNLTRWINQTRKKKMIVLYTTQHINQVEMRVRKATDILIYTERKNGQFWATFIDWQYKTIGRRFLIAKPYRFFKFYDTYEVLQPIKMGKMPNDTSLSQKCIKCGLTFEGETWQTMCRKCYRLDKSE